MNLARIKHPKPRRRRRTDAANCNFIGFEPLSVNGAIRTRRKFEHASVSIEAIVTAVVVIDFIERRLGAFRRTFALQPRHVCAARRIRFI